MSFAPAVLTSATSLPAIRGPNVLKRLTVGYTQLLTRCSATTAQILTQPKCPAGNFGLDNERNDLILHVGDIIGTATSLEGVAFSMDEHTVSRYRVVELLGVGSFGQVVRCLDLNTQTFVALKVLKNRPAYFKQGLIEVSALYIVVRARR